MEKQEKNEYKTQITITRKDNSIRVINVQGLWNHEMAISLGKDLDGNNYFSAQTKTF